VLLVDELGGDGQLLDRLASGKAFDNLSISELRGRLQLRQGWEEDLSSVSERLATILDKFLGENLEETAAQTADDAD
jgi:hypothetical protein